MTTPLLKQALARLMIEGAAVIYNGPHRERPLPPAQGFSAVRTNKKSTRNIGRNEPCPCGSNLKFKKCHGK